MSLSVHHYKSAERNKGRGKPWVVMNNATRKRVGSYATKREAMAVLNELEAGSETPSANGKAKDRSSRTAITKGVSAYLAEVERGGSSTGLVMLGSRSKHFPASTDDPAVVEQVIAHILLEASKLKSPVARLKKYQRANDLRAQLNHLGQPSHREFFVEHGAAWSAEHGVGWSAFRSVGVPAEVLKAAGIPRD